MKKDRRQSGPDAPAKPERAAEKKKASRRGKDSSPAARFRRIVRRVLAGAAVAVVALCGAGDWFVHHPPEWMFEQEARLPKFVTGPLEWFGYRTGDVTDALGWTGSDVVFEIDEFTDPDPEEPMFFAGAGAPRRRAAPAPDDIEVLKRDHFAVGWSPSLRRPAWVAYHVKPEAKYPDLPGERPGFKIDRSAGSSPSSGDYTNSGYQRGHMAPNHAIASRYGRQEQEKTFLMSNIAPQKGDLNEGPWQNLEMRIADLWAEKYGEIWVIVGAVPGSGRGKIGGKGKKAKKEGRGGVDVPEAFFQIIVARRQTEDEAAQTVKSEVRVLAVLMPQTIARDAYYTRNIVSVKDLEAMTGLEFFPGLDGSISGRMAADRASRLWPVGFKGVFRLIAARFIRRGRSMMDRRQ